MRCHGKTRVGKKCSITSASTLTDDKGKLVALPLQRGGDYCALHAKPFQTRPADVDASRAVILVFVDTETTGVNIARDRTALITRGGIRVGPARLQLCVGRIVELAAFQSPADNRLPGSSFSTVVRVDQTILRDRGGEAAEVHGISEEEIAGGPSFVEAWALFLQWIDGLWNTAVLESDGDSSDADARPPQVPEQPPIVMLAAHNGIRFDFPLLLCEVMRHRLPCTPFEDWLFVDTLVALQVLARHSCLKLQCLALRVVADTGRAHRALDDCVCLRQVAAALAQGVDMPLSSFLLRFAVELDMPSSLAQLSVLMGPS